MYIHMCVYIYIYIYTHELYIIVQYMIILIMISHTSFVTAITVTIRSDTFIDILRTETHMIMILMFIMFTPIPYR